MIQRNVTFLRNLCKSTLTIGFDSFKIRKITDCIQLIPFKILSESELSFFFFIFPLDSEQIFRKIAKLYIIDFSNMFYWKYFSARARMRHLFARLNVSYYYERHSQSERAGEIEAEISPKPR